jgi:hypothetical protein
MIGKQVLGIWYYIVRTGHNEGQTAAALAIEETKQSQPSVTLRNASTVQPRQHQAQQAAALQARETAKAAVQRKPILFNNQEVWKVASLLLRTGAADKVNDINEFMQGMAQRFSDVHRAHGRYVEELFVRSMEERDRKSVV